MVEKDLRDIVKDNWTGWIDWLEPRGNAGIGRPDCDLLVDREIAPVELKIADSFVGGWFTPSKVGKSEIRAEQISWHHRFWSSDGTAFFLIATAPDVIWIANRVVEAGAKYKTWRFNEYMLVDLNHFHASICGFVRRMRAS